MIIKEDIEGLKAPVTMACTGMLTVKIRLSFGILRAPAVYHTF